MLNTGEYILPCRNIDSLPDVVFKFGGVEYRLTPQDYVLQVHTKILTEGLILTNKSTQNENVSIFGCLHTWWGIVFTLQVTQNGLTQCISGFLPLDLYDGWWILGDVFIGIKTE